MSGAKKAVLGVVAAPLVVIALLAAAWGVDTWMHRDDVVRNVELAGEPVGGMSRVALTKQVQRAGAELPDTPVRIEAGDLTLDTTAGALGLSVDEERTVDQVWDVGRDDPLPTRPVRWFSSFMDPRPAPAHLDVDAGVLTAELARLEGDRRTAPVEPTLTADESGVKLVPGTNGMELTTNEVVKALPTTLGKVGEPITIEVERAVTEPRLTDASVQALVDQAEPGHLRQDHDDRRRPDHRGGGQGLPPRLRGGRRRRPGGAHRPPHHEARGGRGAAGPERTGRERQPDQRPLRHPGWRPGSRGRAGRSGLLRAGRPGQDRGRAAGGPDRGGAAHPDRHRGRRRGLGQHPGRHQVVGEFTTKHPAGQPRVTNIHRISDETRGVLIAPGDTFSVNDFVGRRTAEKGYVLAPVIENGEHVEDIGGGVSQYATTLFNAAFFGGLDIPAYKAHSEYISRYPYGREATVAYPSVDLKVRNNTPYGVVIWPTYTGLVGDGAAVVHPVRRGCPDRPEPVQRVRQGHHRTDPDLRGRPRREGQVQRQLQVLSA